MHASDSNIVRYYRFDRYGVRNLIAVSYCKLISEELVSLSILGNSADMVEKFIREYNVSPYTYIFSLRSFDIQSVSMDIKPFTYDLKYYTIAVLKTLPTCVVYYGNYGIRSTCDEEREYEIGKAMQKSISLVKSARR